MENTFTNRHIDADGPIVIKGNARNTILLNAILKKERQERKNRSTGPRTEAGKNKAKINARVHGFTGQFYCFSEQDETEYNKFRDAMIAGFKPVGALETQLAVSIAEDHWRLNRARALEHNIYGLAADGPQGEINAGSPQIHTAATQARTWLTDSNNFAKLSLYESRIRRTIERNRKELKEEQATREAKLNQAIEEARILKQLDESEGLAWNPETYFPKGGEFDFSTPEMKALLHKAERLEKAKELQIGSRNGFRTQPKGKKAA